MRQPSNETTGTSWGTQVEEGLSTFTTSSDMVAADGIVRWPGDTAQQLSACPGVVTCAEPPPDSDDPCIGQSPSATEQQIIFAEGDMAQPVQSAGPAVPRPAASRNTAARLNRLTTRTG